VADGELENGRTANQLMKKKQDFNWKEAKTMNWHLVLPSIITPLHTQSIKSTSFMLQNRLLSVVL
jgi:hypothetical protein